MAWRRIQKREDAAAYRARRYVNTETGETLSRKQYDNRYLRGGKSNEAAIKERRAERMARGLPPTTEAQMKAMATRGRNRELRELMGRQAELAPADRRIINKYLASGHKYEKLTKGQKTRFRNLFTEYPRDLVRQWLGSSEESRQMRQQFDRAAHSALPGLGGYAI